MLLGKRVIILRVNGEKERQFIWAEYFMPNTFTNRNYGSLIGNTFDLKGA